MLGILPRPLKTGWFLHVLMCSCSRIEYFVFTVSFIGLKFGTNYYWGISLSLSLFLSIFWDKSLHACLGTEGLVFAVDLSLDINIFEIGSEKNKNWNRMVLCKNAYALDICKCHCIVIEEATSTKEKSPQRKLHRISTPAGLEGVRWYFPKDRCK